MLRRYTIKLYPTKLQAERLEQWSATCRTVYNAALEERYGALEKQNKWLNFYDQVNQIPEIREMLPWVKEVSTDCLRTSSLKRSDTAFKRWSIQKISKRPKFKKKGSNFSLEFGDSTRFEVRGKKIRFEKLRLIKFRGKLPFGNRRTCTILKKAGDWYCSIVLDVPAKQTAQLPGAIGLDVGLTHFMADSNGILTESPNFLKKSAKKLAKLQRIGSRKQKGSNRSRKHKAKVARLHLKVHSQRMDFLHRLSTAISNSHGIVVMEDLQIANMVRNHNLAKSISDQGWGYLRAMVDYKVEANLGVRILVAPHFTSQLCHICDTLGTRKSKSFTCLEHGVFDADVNAACNILKRGLKSTYSSRKAIPLLKIKSVTIAEGEEFDNPLKRLTQTRKKEGAVC